MQLLHKFWQVRALEQWQSTSRNWFLSLILKLFLQNRQIVFDALRTWQTLLIVQKYFLKHQKV